ncbi:hypothetical protein O6H91_21G033700 [Diphasiastrum complanatum]|uniref:Uncharacterized protein n=1 Tax=Diphasiastrum complanatum TaxID=34168 RepID=A0ACC2AL32_DIPCM|nr:hypothetical protein O6H91_21G033700 [Diphasiastrum complanatum]
MEPERPEKIPEIPVSISPLSNEAIFDQFMVRSEFRSFASETQERFQSITDRFHLEQTLQQLREMLVGSLTFTLMETHWELPDVRPKVPTPSEAMEDVPLTSERVRLSAKDVQNLTYSSEEKERTVDNVSAFLFHWTNYHNLTGTPDHLRPTETRLFLRGKSSKWWNIFPRMRKIVIGGFGKSAGWKAAPLPNICPIIERPCSDSP